MKKAIIIVPSSHIAGESIKKIKKIIEKENPDCVAVELDLNRYFALKQKQTSGLSAIKKLGVLTFIIYLLLKKIQASLGRKTGIFPGSDMLQAVETAKENNIDVFFIDRDIMQTMMKIKATPLKEKLKLIFFTIFGALGSEKENIDLNEVPSKNMIKKAMQEFRAQFPYLYKVLVTERNIHMAKNLKQLSRHFNKIIAVVGAGHAEDIKNLLE